MNHNKIKKIFLALSLLVTFVSLTTSSLEAANLHAIIVADTLDRNIGLQTGIDFDRMRRELKYASQQTGLTLKETLFEGNEVDPDKMFDAINNLEIAEDDVVVFYFSGHGFRTLISEESPWPTLSFGPSSKAVELSFIGRKLEERKPRFLLVIADACNSYLPWMLSPTLVRKAPFFGESLQDYLKANYQTLFMDPKGIIMVTSSKKGEYSWSTSSGGLFTLAFLSQLNFEVLNLKEVSWDSILEKSSKKIEVRQHPDYRIYLD